MVKPYKGNKLLSDKENDQIRKKTACYGCRFLKTFNIPSGVSFYCEKAKRIKNRRGRIVKTNVSVGEIGIMSEKPDCYQED